MRRYVHFRASRLVATIQLLREGGPLGNLAGPLAASTVGDERVDEGGGSLAIEAICCRLHGLYIFHSTEQVS